MSYILDALKKSQHARNSGPPQNRGAVHNLSLSFPSVGSWALFILVLTLGIGIGAYFFWRGAPVENSGLTRDVPAQASSPEPAAPSATPKPAVATAAPDTMTNTKSEPVGDLAEQAKLPAPVELPKPPPARSVRKSAAKAQEPVNEPLPTTASAPAFTENVPLLLNMPQDFQRALPPLAVTIHVYSTDESQRILFINNREYRPGSRIDGGIQVLAIVPDGAVLSFRGERFKLSRPR